MIGMKVSYGLEGCKHIVRMNEKPCNLCLAISGALTALLGVQCDPGVGYVSGAGYGTSKYNNNQRSLLRGPTQDIALQSEGYDPCSYILPTVVAE